MNMNFLGHVCFKKILFSGACLFSGKVYENDAYCWIIHTITHKKYWSAKRA